MSLSAAVVSILTSAVITLGLRAFPFLVFGKQRRMPDKLVRLGDMLPSAIMAVLMIYCLKDVGTDWMGDRSAQAGGGSDGHAQLSSQPQYTGEYFRRHRRIYAADSAAVKV